MFENKDLGSEVLAHPLNAQAYALSILEERIGGTLRVSDVNSPFCHLLEFGASINNLAVSKSEDAFRSLYTRRAQTMDDLYKHMTDYDYLNLFSSPATATIDLILNKDQIMKNAASENDLYYRVDIPRGTIFTLGKFTFGIHYPIIVRITKATGTVITTYDTSVDNPLFALSGNMVESSTSEAYGVANTEETYSGINIVTLRIPIYQFARSVWTEDLISPIGFGKGYKYNNRFYAVRIFTTVDGKKIELAQSLSPTMYDPTTATAKITVDEDANKFRIDIPQIYFTNKKVGAKLQIELYTTIGALDVDLGQLSLTNSMVNFNLSSSEAGQYSATLKYPVTLGLRLAKSKVVGGSNGFGFDELRDRVVNQNFYQSVPLTPSDVEKFFSDKGFTVAKDYDGITDRVFTCHRALTDSDGSTVAAAMSSVVVRKDIENEVSTIIRGNDNSVTVLPSTIYRFNNDNQQSIPLTDSERSVLEAYDKETLVELFNNDTYTRSPFHVRLDMTDQYPTAKTFNLNTPYIDKFLFEKENVTIASTMVAYAFDIQTTENGYVLYFSVSKSADIAELDEEYTYIYVHTNTVEGLAPGQRATFVNKVNNYWVYAVNLTSDYKIDDNDRLNLTSLSANGFTDHFVKLDCDFHITYMLNRYTLPDTALQGGYDVIAQIPDDILAEYYGLIRQKVSVHFGHSLNDILYNTINISYTTETYKRYEIDEPLVYTEDVYARDTNGVPIIDMVDGAPALRIVHQQGEEAVDESGNPLYKHRAGELMYDNYGVPIKTQSRDLVYEVDIMQFDAKVFLSEHPDQKAFVSTLLETLESYFGTVREVGKQVLERTSLYFKPVRSIGLTKYGIGDGLTYRDNLSLSFRAKYYTKPYVLQSTTLQETIRKATIAKIEEAIRSKVISCNDIFRNIKDQLSDYIYQIDVLGINGDVTLQSLVVLDTDTQPSLAKQLLVSKDNTLYLDHMVDIEFVSSDATR